VDSWHVNYGYLLIAELLYWYDWQYQEHSGLELWPGEGNVALG